VRILNVVWGDYPDIRVQKTSRILSEAGHRVDVLALADKGSTDAFVKVRVAELPTNPVERLVRRTLVTLKRSPVAFSWRHERAFVSALDTAPPYDVVIWNDLPGVVEGARHAHRRGIRFVFDMHENYADNMWSTERDLGVRSFQYNVNAWLAYEAEALRAADTILVNVEEMGERAIGMHFTPPEKFAVVKNAEPPDLWRDVTASDALRGRFAGKFVLLFVGSSSVHRGVDTIVKAMPEVLARHPDTVLVVVGSGNGIAGWKEETARLGLGAHVFFEGRKPFREAQQYYRIGHIGVIPHYKYGQTDNGIPHKFAQNLVCGLPILASSCHSMERIVRETGCGEVFRAGQPRDAARAIIAMREGGQLTAMRERALALAETGAFSWASMSRSLVEAIGNTPAVGAAYETRAAS
jgi:glycosyltransferase involved in cell wall biosynthesis